jgi:hypothetical protein
VLLLPPTETRNVEAPLLRSKMNHEHPLQWHWSEKKYQRTSLQGQLRIRGERASKSLRGGFGSEQNKSRRCGFSSHQRQAEEGFGFDEILAARTEI